MIVGEYGSKIYFFKRNADGSLNARVPIADSEGNTDHDDGKARFIAPVIVDWNNDGLLDMLVGLSNQGFGSDGWDVPGYTKLFINEGTKQNYKFAYKGYLLTTQGDTIKHDYQRVQCRDMNNDGKKDFICSHGYREPEYGIYYYENTNTDAAPEFTQGVMLRKTDGNLLDAQYYVIFGLTDWNSDGVTDILYCTSANGMSTSQLYLSLGNLPSDIVTPAIAKIRSPISIIQKANNLIITATSREGLISLYSVKGEKVYMNKTGSAHKTVTIPVGDLATGVYMIRLVNENIIIEQSIVIRN